MKRISWVTAVTTLALYCAAPALSPAYADSTTGAAPPAATASDTINLSHDLVRLGIAANNLPSR